MNRVDVGRAAQAACILEAVSTKPGNVNRNWDFADTTLPDFLLSAVMIGHAMEEADRRSLGETILIAVESTRSAVDCNTNLGMILLFAPLAQSCGNGDLRSSLKQHLQAATVEDARLVSRAIRMARPGGLGHVAAQDVKGDPDVSLIDLMMLARDRDAIAREYVTGYERIFEHALPTLHNAMARCGDLLIAAVEAYLVLLSQFPDTLILRKLGMQSALEVSQQARRLLADRNGDARVNEEQLRSFDAFLRSEGNRLNPGATADLTAAAIYIYLLQEGLHAWHRSHA